MVQSDPLLGVTGLTRGRIVVLRELEEFADVLLANLNRAKETGCLGTLHRNISANRFLGEF